MSTELDSFFARVTCLTDYLFASLKEIYEWLSDTISSWLTEPALGQVVAIVAALAAIIGTVYGIKAYRHGKKSEKKPGEITASLFIPDCENEIYFLFPLEHNRHFLIPLVILLRNTGEEKVEDVEIHMRLSDLLYNREVERRVSKFAEAKQMKHIVDKQEREGVTGVYMTYFRIPPGELGMIKEWVGVSFATERTVPVDATTKDGVDVHFGVQVTFSIPLDLIVTWNGNRIEQRKYNLHIRKGAASTIREFVLAEQAKLGDSETKEPDYRFTIITIDDVTKCECQVEPESENQLYICDPGTLRVGCGGWSEGKAWVSKSFPTLEYTSSFSI